jgi:hypothetical protein
MFIVCWKSCTGRLCEWETPDETEARELVEILIAVGMVASLERLPELDAAWMAEEVLTGEG